MVASSWTLRVEPASEEEIAAWLASETTSKFSMILEQDEILVELGSIDDAFRFRMRFDEIIRTI